MAESGIRSRLRVLEERMAAAAARAGRDPAGVTLVAVTKTVPVELIEEAIGLGVKHVGENRVQEASAKFDKIGRKATWHMVGHLQSNKVKRALEIFDVIQSVDSVRLAEAVSQRAVEAQLRTRQRVDILLEVNTSGEASKFGFKPEEVAAAAGEISVLDGLRVRGLMTVGPIVERPEDSRPAFALLRELADRISGMGLSNVDTSLLSMGMSGDFEVAIEEGATLIRVGTAIFGPRQ
ncbi:MAG: YggS family pyridoxal phosphate-dependent enzyme [Candidatus Eisenbacteria bacterium]|nr:YggS family pyridoxal phosphate-dependent enzyme [Candidatus Eisenbacteria bacterium]